MVKPLTPQSMILLRAEGLDKSETSSATFTVPDHRCEELEKICSPVETTNNLSPKKMSGTLKRRKSSNSMQRINRAMEKLRKENQLQLVTTDAESEAEKQSETWKESLNVSKHAGRERHEPGQSKAYHYANGAVFVLGRMYATRKPGKGWLDSSHH